ncbi:MAG: amidohydrolase family protein [Deltaproteobacteria bacterium]|nr:amidohydrolase family protein [Deltaproteobacteria bacterium]
MENFDFCFRGGKVHVSGALIDGDLCVQGEKIALVAKREMAHGARRVIDVSGKWLLPGIIDLHAHSRDPGYTQKEDFFTISQAAAAGGVTTWVDMPNVEPPTTTVELFQEKRSRAEKLSLVDFGHFASGVNLEEIPKLAGAGVTGFKIFQVSGAYPHDPRLALNDEGKLLQSFRAISKTGLPCVVHPFNQSLFDFFSEEAFAQGKPKNHVTFAEIYTREVVWESAVASLLMLQRESGARLHVVHTHAARSLRLLRQAKSRGQSVTVEIDPKYFHLGRSDLEEKGPKICPAGFIPEDKERMEEIWRSFRDGTIDNIGSDHAPHTSQEVERQRADAWTAAMGNPQYDHYLSVFMNDVHDGKISLADLVRCLSENPARILGIYPRKGTLLPGADADLVVVDPERERTLSDQGVYTKVGWSPYAGWKVKGVPVLTMARGRIVAEEGMVVGEPGFGKFIGGVPQ